MPCKDVEWQASVQVWQHFAVKHGAKSVACSLQSNYAGQQLPGIDAACLSMACAVLRPMQNADSCSFLLNAWQVLCPALKFASSMQVVCLPGAAISRNTAALQQPNMLKEFCTYGGMQETTLYFFWCREGRHHSCPQTMTTPWELAAL